MWELESLIIRKREDSKVRESPKVRGTRRFEKFVNRGDSEVQGFESGREPRNSKNSKNAGTRRSENFENPRRSEKSVKEKWNGCAEIGAKRELGEDSGHRKLHATRADSSRRKTIVTLSVSRPPRRSRYSIRDIRTVRYTTRLYIRYMWVTVTGGFMSTNRRVASRLS